ncbi:major capsid protein [Apilactobacillus xinyiensis]|uniref:major capsid protein n=1 Tax=Apilactobacillus xinyiensis TaxID=2841032 RepID=UPI003364BA55
MASITELRSLQNVAAYYERKVMALPPYMSESYFRNNPITSDKLQYLISKVSAPELAKTSSYDADPKPSNRDGFSKKVLGTQFFRQSSTINEMDVMDLNEAAAGNQSDAYLMPLLRNLFDNQTKDLLSMRARRNYLGVKALIDAKIPLKVGGQVQTFEFDTKSEFQQDSTTDWSNTKTSNIYEDVRKVLKTMRQIGIYPNQVIMNDNTFNMIQRSDNLKATVPTQNINIANGNLSETQVADYFKSEFKLAIVRYDGVYKESDLGVNDDNNLKQYIDDGKVVFLSAPLPDNSFIVPTSNTSQIIDLSGGQYVGNMNFAPTPESIGLATGRYGNDEVMILDTGVAFHRYRDRKLNREEDITAMNVFPSLEGSQTIFRLKVCDPDALNKDSSSTKQPSENNSQSDGQTTPPKA